MKNQEATMFMITLKSGDKIEINDYKLFDESGIEPENYTMADYKKFKYLVEVFSDENTEAIKGKSFVCDDIINIKISNEFILIKDQDIPLYFESREILNTNTISLDDAMNFDSKEDAVNYNNKYLYGEFEVLPVSEAVKY